MYIPRRNPKQSWRVGSSPSHVVKNYLMRLIHRQAGVDVTGPGIYTAFQVLHFSEAGTG